MIEKSAYWSNYFSNLSIASGVSGIIGFIYIDYRDNAESELFYIFAVSMIFFVSIFAAFIGWCSSPDDGADKKKVSQKTT